MIVFDKVGKSYPNGHQALLQISLEVKASEMVFLTGHSGAGKSTMLKLIGLMERCTRGKLFLNEFDLSQARKNHIPHIRRSIGFVFQNPNLLNDRTLFENVALPLHIAGMPHREIGRRVRAALDKVNLLDKEKLFPENISAGEQQRAGIARAIVNKPPILLADEPTGNLDPDLSREIIFLFEQFQRVGVTVMIATHDLPLIAEFAHRILVLKEGRLLARRQ